MNIEKFVRYFLIIALSIICSVVCLFIYNSTYVLQESFDKSSIEHINESFEKGKVEIFLLNLDRSPERLEHMKPLLTQLEYEYTRVSAVDGSKISANDLIDKVDKERFKKFRGRFPRLGEIGCALSHRKALLSFLNSNAEFALIFEDDIEFNPIVLKNLVSKAIHIAEDWDIIAMQLNHKGLPSKVAELGENHHLVKYYFHVVEAGGYLINRKAAKKYLTYFLPIILPYDYFYNRPWEYDITFRGIEPRIINQVLDHSYILSSQNMKASEEAATNLERDRKISKKVFNTSTSIMAFIYTLLAS